MMWATWEEEQVFIRIDEWLDKADNEQDDPFNRFISLWISYNMLYSMYSKKIRPNENKTRNDRCKAIRVKNLILSSDELSIFIQGIIPEFIDVINRFREEKWNNDDNRTLNDYLCSSYQNDDYDNVLENILKLLYKYRCNLFHGEKGYYNSDQKELLTICSDILFNIIRTALINYKNQYQNSLS